MNIAIGLTTFTLMSSFFFWGLERQSLRIAFHDVCSRIESEYVRAQEPKVQAFLQHCYAEVDRDANLAFFERESANSKHAFIKIVNDKLSALRISHLAAYSPSETIAMWSSEALDTGVRARLVDAEVVVTRVIPGAPGERAGIKPGDLIVAVDGDPVQSPEEVVNRSGMWDVLTPSETRVLMPVQAEVLIDPVEPYWVQDQQALPNHNRGVRILRIPSFLPNAFAGEAWPRIAAELASWTSDERALIIDLRGNAGGSFPAMLRAVGALTCRRELIGWVHRGEVPKIKSASSANQFQDSLDTDLQLDQLAKGGSIALVPLGSSDCYDGPLVVIIDQGTASVAEIFAQAMKERPHSKIVGWRTAGQVVMARWFQIAGLGTDYTLAVPVALYHSAKGEELESRGISPDQILTDDLKRWRSRTDPWINDAASILSRSVSH